jgi:organic radical activating enzyme
MGITRVANPALSNKIFINLPFQTQILSFTASIIDRQKESLKSSAKKINGVITSELKAANENTKVQSKADREKLDQAIKEYRKATKTATVVMETTTDDIETYEKLGRYLKRKGKSFNDALKEFEEL